MKTIMIMAIFATVAFAGIVEYGPQVGYWAPTGDAADAFSGNLYIGGQILFRLPMLAVEGSVGYLSLKPDVEIAGYSGYIIPVAAGIRSYMGPLYAVGGLELDMQTVDLGDGEDVSENDFSGYIGAGVVPAIPFVTDIDASVRLHFVDFSDMWVGITVGLNF
ncbi:MAG: hypothetical protein KAH31_11045 [Candidatus Sabulitectum sp.]|nr:hypothetical protein [Candidatus Sabulitectum sp.]